MGGDKKGGRVQRGNEVTGERELRASFENTPAVVMFDQEETRVGSSELECKWHLHVALSH